MTAFLVALILYFILRSYNSLNKSQSEYDGRKYSMTNKPLQIKIQRAFENLYREKLKKYDREKDLCTALETLYIESGLRSNEDYELGGCRLIKPFSDTERKLVSPSSMYVGNGKTDWEKYDKYRENEDAWVNETTAYERVMGIDRLKTFYEKMITEEVMRSLWRKKLKYAFIKKSEWQEEKYSLQQYKNNKSHYPWEH